jgi:nucleoid-associated protein YgaU
MTVFAADAVPGLLVAGASSGELHKLTIFYEQGRQRPDGSVQALFNPSEISLTRSAQWGQRHAVSQVGQLAAAVIQEFYTVEADGISLDLFFDTYEIRSGTVIGLRAGSDVRRYTGRIAELLSIDSELHRPPVCRLQWGAFDIFTGVLTGLSERFTLFLPDGTPVRATLSCEFAQVTSVAHARVGELHSSDVIRTRLVRRDDTLQSLAADEYGDAALWRPIALANGIVSPRSLRPGTMLMIPSLRP